jgi:DNA-binding NarL/FixJ family response regulator
VKTVQNHVSNVLAKLQARDRTQAVLRMRGLH